MQSHGPQADLLQQIRSAVLDALPGAHVEVTGAGGHFSLAVTSTAFEGKSTLAKQRLVLSAIKHLMAGDHAPVHAIDSLKTLVP